MRLALFDLDSTLIPGDSDHAFGEWMVALGWADREEFGRSNDAFYADYQAGCLDIAAYIEFATRSWRDREAGLVNEAVQAYLEQAIAPMIKPVALELVRQHQQAGDVCVLVTATMERITRPIAGLFGIQHLIATELERDPGGRVTGNILGVPSFREGKVVRVQQWLAERGSSLEGLERSTFYSDSTNDLALLERVSHPVATNPSPALERLAQTRNWPVLKLFT